MAFQRKQVGEQDAFQKLSAMCASAEHCTYEMMEKMRRWQLPDDAAGRVMQRLKDGKFVDDERYCRAFVLDKIRYNKWGRRKVEQALFMKRIDEGVAQEVLDEVDGQEYLDVLAPLIESKRKTTKAANDYELNCKLIRFALGRGFSMDEIRSVL